MKTLIAMFVALGLLIVAPQVNAGCGSCEGGDKACSKEKSEKADKADKKDKSVTITGKITKEVKKNKSDKDVVKYFLVDSAGKKINLPNKTDVKFEDFVNADVKVTGTGTTKKDGTVNKLKSVTTIEKVETPAPAAAATPAPAPAEKK